MLDDIKISDLLKVIDCLGDNKTTQSINKALTGDYRIVVLQRGWVVVGRLFRNGSDCILENASVIRTWGTTKGLGEIALNGPTPKTILDKTSNLRFHELGIVTTLDTEEKLWN